MDVWDKKKTIDNARLFAEEQQKKRRTKKRARSDAKRESVFAQSKHSTSNIQHPPQISTK